LQQQNWLLMQQMQAVQQQLAAGMMGQHPMAMPWLGCTPHAQPPHAGHGHGLAANIVYHGPPAPPQHDRYSPEDEEVRVVSVGKGVYILTRSRRTRHLRTINHRAEESKRNDNQS
jgi:hypothetical protein